MAPARTGKDSRSRIAVTNTDQGNRDRRLKTRPITRRFIRVVIKLTAPRREEIPAKCKEKIAKSTEAPAWARLLLKGG